MKLFIETNNKLFINSLSSKSEESYIVNFFSNGIERRISLSLKDNKWYIYSSKDYSVYNGSSEVNNIELNNNLVLTINFIGEKVNLYCMDSFTLDYQDYDISSLDTVSIANTDTANIRLNISSEIILQKENGFYYLVDNACQSFLNNCKTKKHYLYNGDVIFIKGTKLIFMGKYIRICGIKPLSINLNIYQKNLTDMSKYVPLNESEKYISLYDEDDLFFHTPQLKFNIKEAVINIDPPPGEIKAEEMPAIFTIGASLMIGLSSVVTGITSLMGIINKTVSLSGALPTLILSLAMIIGSFILPIFANRYQKKMLIKKEKIRQEKYLQYLNEKKDDIQNAINEQSKILSDNFLDLDSIANNIKSDNKKIWNKEITDNDFLTVRLGTGNKKANIVVNAPAKQFSLEDDNLKEAVNNLANSPLMMKNVPITVSFIDNNVFPMILECTNKKAFIDGILLQLIAAHSPVDLKLVFFINKENENNYSYAKYLYHTLSNDKSIRFFATTEDEMKIVSTYLENEYNERKIRRKNLENDAETYDRKEYYKEESTYYLIITDNFKMAKDSSIVNKILETNSNYGFSLLMLESNMKNLPSKCDRFAKIVDGNSGLFGKDLSSKDQLTYKAEYLTSQNMDYLTSIISNVPVSSLSIENMLPKMLEFLEMYNVGKIEQLNILNKWETNNPTNSLAAPVGVYKSGNKFDLDLHEKFHGPHGLIAGMTGSGKSEFIITYILSMAINYHPDEVQFVLIDYKGGGLVGAFENKEANIHLPHVIGTITNLDVSEMNRTLVSIKSELKRRQKIFNEVREKTGESTIDIYKYQKLHREGVIKEPISHLFIISDEFAELKDQQPEFMDELISTARIGRSLGVHLILATQKPSGVVNDQIWSNTRFRVCLKVQSAGDSIEMLKRPEAANIKETGRFYLQVGYDELFELGQSAWSGARYQPSDKYIKKTNDSIDFINSIGYIQKSINDVVQKDTSKDYGDQLSNIVKHISALATKENIIFNKLWLPKMPDVIILNDLIKKYNYKRDNNDVVAIIGEYDNPEEQMQGLFNINFTQTGSTAIIGIPGSGKENLLITLIYSLSIYYSPQDVNIYVLDFGTESLKILEGIPQIGDVITIQDKEKTGNLFKYLDREMTRRKQLFSNFNGSFIDYNRLSGHKLPLIITCINNFESFLENGDEEYGNTLMLLFREGIKYGIIFILSATTFGSVKSGILQYFSNLICLQLADSFDYKYYMEAQDGLIPTKIKGRGLARINEKVFEFQTSYIANKDQINDQIKSVKELLINKYKDIRAKRIPQIPTVINSESMLPYAIEINKLPIGIEHNEFVIYYHNFMKHKINPITGNTALSNLQFICGIIDQINKFDGNHIELIDTTYSINIDQSEGNLYNSDYDSALDNIIKNCSDDSVNNFVIIAGLKEFIDGLSDPYKEKFNQFITYIKNKKIYLIIIDNYNSYKKYTLDKWYLDNVDNSYGLWMGTGINVQVVFNINNLTSEDANQDFNGLIYAIEDGEYHVIKGIGE